MTAHRIPELDEAGFDREVLRATTPVLVDFTATWCGPCRALSPVLSELAAARAGRLKVVSVNVESSPGLAARFRVTAFPTVIAFGKGKELARHVGLTTAKKLLTLLDEPPAA